MARPLDCLGNCWLVGFMAAHTTSRYGVVPAAQRHLSGMQGLCRRLKKSLVRSPFLGSHLCQQMTRLMRNIQRLSRQHPRPRQLHRLQRLPVHLSTMLTQQRVASQQRLPQRLPNRPHVRAQRLQLCLCALQDMGLMRMVRGPRWRRPHQQEQLIQQRGMLWPLCRLLCPSPARSCPGSPTS